MKADSGLQVFLPQHLVRPALDRRWTADRASDLSGAFLFSDISGFTALSEKFSELGTEGAERIAAEISRCFDPLLDTIDRYGGSVLRFGGDALLVYFSAGDGDAAQRAWFAATEIVHRVEGMKPVPAPACQVKLGVKVGLHVGKILGLTADLGDGRREYVTLGADLNRLAECESAAGRGQIVASCEFRISLGLSASLRSGPCAIDPAPLRLLSSLRNKFLLQWGPNVPSRSFSPAVIEWMSGFVPAAVAARQSILGGRVEWMAEMRRITAMFINVAGLGRLADRGRADAAEKIELYFSSIRAITNRHGGFFFASDLYDVGDKIIVIFGAPVSLDRDEEHAIDAAREIMTFADRLGLPIRQRIGLTSGPAFCGLVGGKRRRVYTVMGDTVNTAARCMSAAGWREIYVHENTFARARGRFWGPRRQFMAKGKSKPVSVYSVKRERSSVGQSAGETPIGREEERRQIETLFSSGSGFMLNLTGEAGVGKSTLLRFAAARWESEGGRVVSADCLPYGASSPFFPWRRALWDFFKFGDDPSAVQIRRALAGMAFADAVLVADLIGVDIGAKPARMDPRQAIEKRMSILKNIMARDPKTMWVFEDIHWMDPNSLDLLRRLLAESQSRPVPGRPGPACRMILTQRPEKELFSDVPAAPATLILKPFGLREAAELAARMLGTGTLSDSALGEIHQKSEGNPFYLTEIFRAMLDGGTKSLLPASVGALLQSRVDHLPEQDRQILRAASVIGRTFFIELLTAISPLGLSDDRLRDVLRRLETAGFVSPLGRTKYEFRHILTQESVYESVTAGLRRSIHLKIAARLERRRQRNVALLAHHYDRAGDAPKAARYLDAAGRHADDIYAHAAALQNYTRAIHWLIRLSAVARGPSERRPPTRRLVSVRRRVWIKNLAAVHVRRASVLKNIGKFVQARSDYTAAERLFLKCEDRISAAVARDSIGICLQREGKHKDARGYSESALRRLRRAGSPAAMAKCLNSLTVAYWYIGNYMDAIRCGEESIEIRRRMNDPESIAHGLFTLGNAYVVTCDFRKAVPCFTELLNVSRRLKDVAGIAYALEGLGNCDRKRGFFGEAIRHHRESFRLREKIGNRRSIVYSCLNESAIYLSMGLPNLAIPRLDRAKEFLKETDEENLVGELWRYRGIAALENNSLYRAAICLERAVRIAQATGFRESEVKALSPLARITSLLGDDLRAAAICDRLKAIVRQSRIMDYCARADLIEGDLAVRQGNQSLARESWKNALNTSVEFGLLPLVIEVAIRNKNSNAGLSLPKEFPSAEKLVTRMAEGLDDSDRRAFESRWRVLIG